MKTRWECLLSVLHCNPHSEPKLLGKKCDKNLVGVFGEVFCAGHHQGGPLLQLPQPLAPLVQSDASPGQLTHHSAGCYLHTLHPGLARDVLSQTPGGLPGRCLANCRQRHAVREKKKMRGNNDILSPRASADDEMYCFLLGLNECLHTESAKIMYRPRKNWLNIWFV